MNKLLNPGRNVFAIGMLALGIICFISKDFIVGRPPAWPGTFEVNPALAYISGFILVISCLAILLKFRGYLAALVIAALIFILSIFRHLHTFIDTWPNGYKSLALFGGSLIIAATFLSPSKNKIISRLVFAGSVLIAAFFIASGYAHFKFDEFVKAFIPAYIPFHAFWTYFCGVCLIAGGIGLIIPYTRKLAALLSGIMIAGWFLLLHIPLMIINSADPSNRMGLCESFAFAGILFALAGLLSRQHDRAFE